jgi:beta-glucosidase/6-phospho-beta-glucosidase/beta-galactosidase
MPSQSQLFDSFFMGGFECSTHRPADGRRLDLIAGTRHDILVAQDYRQAAEHGIRTIRDGVRWHLVEATPGRYDWSSLLPLLRAAEVAGSQVIWDLCHYGWPDHIDIWSPAFVEGFAAYAAAFARLHREETGRPPLLCPVNEIAFFAWAGAEVGIMNPCVTGRADALKRQLVRAALAGTAAVRAAVPGSRAFAIDPIIHLVPRPHADPEIARGYNALQYEGWDMLTGQREPELGGSPDAVDAIGVNFYWNNQWLCPDAAQPADARPDWYPSRDALSLYDPRWRPLRDMLTEVHTRYGCPLFVAETSIEGAARPDWLRYVCEEVRAAILAGVPVEGICLYPILSHPGWDDDRYCPNGLFELEARDGQRVVYAPLAAELTRQRALFKDMPTSTPRLPAWALRA